MGPTGGERTKQGSLTFLEAEFVNHWVPAAHCSMGCTETAAPREVQSVAGGALRPLLAPDWFVMGRSSTAPVAMRTQARFKLHFINVPGKSYLSPTPGGRTDRGEDNVCIPHSEVTIRKNDTLPLSYDIKRTFTQRSKMEKKINTFSGISGQILNPYSCTTSAGSCGVYCSCFN